MLDLRPRALIFDNDGAEQHIEDARACGSSVQTTLKNIVLLGDYRLAWLGSAPELKKRRSDAEPQRELL